jgi:SAM-dependent methyltransferase
MDWDARYRAGDLGPSEPHRLVIEAADLMPAGRALDLACGAGRNARYLAQRGWKVTAVDRSIAAIQIVRGVLADLERDAPPIRDASFDLVCIINFLHRPLFAEALRLLRPAGMVAAAIRTSGNFSLPPGELRAYFSGCRIVVDRPGEIIVMGSEL